MGASTWHGLSGTPGYLAGASGSVVLPAGAILIAIVAHATSAGTLTIFGGPSIPITAGSQWSVDFKHALMQSYGTGGSATLIFTGTDSYFVHWVRMGNT